MKYKDLTEQDFEIMRKVYSESENKAEAQKILAKNYDVTKRTIRKWANKIGLNVMKHNMLIPSKIMIYDIETSRVPAMVWWTGKQYIGHDQLQDEPHIITIAWKWLGEDEIFTLSWDKDGSDKEMLKKFLKQYNQATMVIGQNNDRFDNRWINARAMKYDLDVNTLIKSFDIMKETKRLFRLPSYSMKYITNYLGVETKLQHEGITMWDKIQFGTDAEKKEYLQKMIDYNRQDIVATEEMYLSLRKYMGHKMHFGVYNGEEKFTCPNCGSYNVKLDKTTVTPAGTIQRVMKCNECEVRYKLSNKQYMNYLEWKMKNK